MLLIGYLIPQLSFVKHLSFAFIALTSISGNKIKIQGSRFVLGMIALLTYGVIIGLPNTSIQITAKSFLLLLSPLFAASLLASGPEKYIERLLIVFFFVAVVFQLLLIGSSKDALTSLGMFQLFLSAKSDGDFLLSTGSSIENSFCFLFGYLALYFLNQRKYGYLVVCLILFLLNYKRIVLGGFVLSFFYWLLFHNRTGKKVALKPLISTIPFISVGLLLILSSGIYNYAISRIIGTSINQLTTGRYNSHHGLFESMFELPNVILGYGLGKSVETLRSFDFTELAWIHSDYLMLFYDLGIVGFLIFFISFNKKFLTSTINATYIIFFFILLFFDNTLIYFDTMFICYTLLLMPSSESTVSISNPPNPVVNFAP